MNLQQITEMAAKKLCATCGKTMAANHYWYKGGWRCKKSALADVEAPANAAAAAAPSPLAATPAAPAPVAQAPAAQPPAAPKELVAVDIKKVKEEIPELEWQDDDFGNDKLVHWQVAEHGGRIDVYWDYTFRRNTPRGAFEENRRAINFANTRIASIANKFATSVISINTLTSDRIKQIEDRISSNGDDLYSEYEQSIGGGITLKG